MKAHVGQSRRKKDIEPSPLVISTELLPVIQYSRCSPATCHPAPKRLVVSSSTSNRVVTVVEALGVELMYGVTMTFTSYQPVVRLFVSASIAATSRVVLVSGGAA